MNILESTILKTPGVYIIFNTKNGKKYIGSTVNLYTRLQKHRSLLRSNKHENSYLQNAWNKYGELYFQYSILEFSNLENLTIKEQYWIDQCNPEYNITKEVVRNTLSKESREKQAQTRRDLFKLGILKPTKTRKINQYDLDGNFIRSWNMVKEASKALNLHQSTIHRVLNNKYKTAGGFIWKYTEDKSVVEAVYNSKRAKYKDLVKLGEFRETPEVDNPDPSINLND